MANETAISLPFTISPYGSVGSTTSQAKIWEDRVLSVIGTVYRERVMRPSFGTVIPYALFESATNAQSEVKAEVESAFATQLPTLTLISVDANLDTYTNILTLTITYALPNDQILSTDIGILSIDGTSPAYEELL